MSQKTMNYFLRNLPNPFEASAFACIETEQEIFSRIRAKYSELLEEASHRRFGHFPQMELQKRKGMAMKQPNCSLKLPNNEAENEAESIAAWEAAWKSLELAAAPSPFGAIALAQSIVFRLKNGNNKKLGTIEWPEHWIIGQLDEQLNAATVADSKTAPQKSMGNFNGTNAIFQQFHQQMLFRSSQKYTAPDDRNPIKLVSLGLDCIFSVLLELNRRDPELCAQSLQSLLQLLQNMEPESLGGSDSQSRQMVGRMHELLRELRREGNASVSAVANGCMMSLAVASGQPDIIYSTIAALICEPKRHLPQNQILADSNPMPRNVQILAKSAQMLIIGNGPNEWSTNVSLDRRPLVCEFDVIYTGSALIGEEEQRMRPTSSAVGGGYNGCLVSDGAYIYLLTQFGLLKMGTGLSETRAGEVIICNELLKFTDGSALFISNESLYLRRKHSSRLWVLDTDNLREIGEIMLPTALTSQGQLFADGRQFFHAQLDEKWNFASIPLDDSFGPCQQEQYSPPNGSSTAERRFPSAEPKIRLIETEFCAFGVDDTQTQMLQSIPPKLRGIAADVQLGTGIAFLLSRCGKIFYAGPEAETGFNLPRSQIEANQFEWKRLSLLEPIVQMALDPTNRTLILRSGAGNLWMVGGSQLTTKSAGKSPKSPKKRQKEDKIAAIRKLKVPNKRKCTSLSMASVGGGCLAFATENGRCFVLGRHVLNTGTVGNIMGPPLVQSSPAKQTPFLVPGLENIPIAQVALAKTHLVAIGKNGALYATGLNNQNQCGHSLDSSNISSSTKTMPTTVKVASTSSTICGSQSTSSHQNQQQQSSSSLASFCSSSCSPSSSHSHQFCSQYSQHFFLDDLASRCVRCGLCSVQGIGCNFSIVKENNGAIAPSTSNAFCPCARTGPSCCLRCGLCRNCADEKRKDKKADNNGFSQNAEKQHRIGMSPKAVRLQLSNRREILGLGNAPLARHEFVEEETVGSAEAEKAKIAPESTMTTRIFGPERVLLQQQPTIKVASISVGNFHTVVLSADNQVYTFGANTFGQLGNGTTEMIRSGAHKLLLPANVQIVQAVAGANHTVLRTLDGRLITFGSYKAGQLGRKRLAMPADDSTTANSSQSTRQWFAEPGFVPGFGQAYGRVASWVSAAGDHTLVQVQHQLLSRMQLAESRINANGECLMIVPPAQNNSQGRPLNIGNNNKGGYLMVKRAGEGNGPRAPAFRNFQWPEMGGEGNGLSKCSFCLDPKHENLLWVYDSQKMCVFALSSASNTSHSIEMLPLFLRHHRQILLRSTELMVPSIMDSTVIVANGQNDGFGLIGSADCSPVRYSDCQLGLFLLSIVYSLCLAAVGGKIDGEDEIIEFGKEIGEDYSINGTNLSALGPKEEEERRMDCRVINRFENFGGGWGYSAHCVEAIQFKTNKDILFCGVGLFGGRGEYTARLKLFRVLEDLDSPSMAQQQCIELLAETDEVLYECGTRETAVLQLERPIPINKQKWHIIWVQITGPSSDCGAAGKAIVRADGENGQESVEFHFRPNALSNNGTNVEVGQIPEFYFLTPSDVDDPKDVHLQQTPKRRPIALTRGTRKCNKIDGNNRKAPYKSQQFIQPCTLFNIHPKSIFELLRIVEWALESGRAFLVSDNKEELLDCDYAWRQERAALIAIFAIRLIRLALCLLPLNGNGISSDEEKLGPTQVLAFHRILRQTLERKINQEDQIGTFLLAEIVSSYVICARLFSPSVELLRNRIVDQFGNSEQNSWWFLALLFSLERMDGQILTIFGNENEKKSKYGGGDELIEAFVKEEIKLEKQQNSSNTILKSLFELAFFEIQEDDEGPLGRSRIISDDSQQNQFNSTKFLQMQLKASALRLLGAIGHHLVAHFKPSLTSEPSAAQIPLQTPSRFRHISAHPQWDVGGNDEAWDAIGMTLKIMEDTRTELQPTILLCGVGIFSGNSSAQMQQNSIELEFLQTVNSEDWHLLERVTAKLDSFPTQIVHFTRQWPLQPDLNYTLRLRFNGVGKTLYGEGGHSSLQFTDQCRIHFMPSGMSQNGSTVSRGQFPFLVYSFAQNCAQKDEKDVNCCANFIDESDQKLFLQLLRFIVQMLGKRIVNRSSKREERILSEGEQTICANILGQTNLLVEYRNELGFEIVAVMDEIIPILANMNSNILAGKRRRMTAICHGVEEIMDESHSRSFSTNGTDEEEEEENVLNIHLRHNQSAEQKNSQPIWLESAHPYRAGQICIHKVAFASAHSMTIRFDPSCKIAQMGDSLWIYSAKEDDSLFPIGQFNHNWLRGRTVPGNKLYFLFESNQRAENESDENCFGLRCSIEPIAHYPFNQISSNHSLEHHFIWCLANACRHLLQIGTQKMEEERREIRELLLNRHAKLARRGIRVGNGRMALTLGQLLRIEWDTVEEEEEKGKERKFMEEFAKGEPLNSAGAQLATAICQLQSFIHLGHSNLRFTPIGPSKEIRLGQPVEIQFVARDQHNRDVVAAEGIEVELVLTNGNGIDQNLAKSSMANEVTAIDWAKLKAEQMKCQFRPMPAGRALYQCISLLPPLQTYSLEELRFSFAYGQPSNEGLRLTRSSEGILLINWTPKRVGLVDIQCLVDGHPLASNQIPKLEVHENGVTSELISPAPISPSLRTLRSQNPAAMQQQYDPAQINRPAISPLRRAHFPSVSPYLAIRVRAHPSLNATQIGQVFRGTWLDFTEILRNNDGMWLRLGETSRNELKLGREAVQKEQNISEAWVLQMNAHLQTEYLQMTPPSNGNFIVSPSNTELSVQIQTEQPPITTISILDSPKFRQKRATEQFGGISPSTDHPRPALGPALLESFRWTFCALCWHSGPETDLYPTVEEMMEAARWLESKSELAINKICQNRKQWNELPANFQKILRAWNELNVQLWQKIERMENDEKIKSESENDLTENARNEEKNVGNLLANCELCGTKCTKPIGNHMRQKHPGCGGPTQTYGYNSAGHWTTGWSGKCGEGGQGKAVWYLLCAKCRQQYLRKLRNSPLFDQNVPLAERLKRNALFLLELNRDKRILAQQDREGRHQPAISIDLYPEVRPKGGVGILQNKKTQWNMSDPGNQLLDQIIEQPSSSSSAIANFGEMEKSGDLMGSIIDFVFVQHDLAKLRGLFRQSLFRAVTFSFTFRLWNWLLKVASVEQSSYDIVWHFFSALRQFSSPNSTSPLLTHPAHLCLLAGPEQIGQMVQQFHCLLQQFTSILQSPRNEDTTTDDKLRCLCFRALTFQLTGHEQALLPTIRSLLSVVGNVLGCSSVDTATTAGHAGTMALSTTNNSAESTAAGGESMSKSCSNGGGASSPQLQKLDNLMESATLMASSRTQLLGCLLDGSCETFWESGEEDRGRGRPRKLIISNWCGMAKFGTIYLNNSLDEGFRVDRIIVANNEGNKTVEGGNIAAEMDPKNSLLDIQLEKNFCGWLKFGLSLHSDNGSQLEIYLYGDEMGCRLRQLCLFGLKESSKENIPQKWQQSTATSSIRPSNSQQQLLFGGIQGDAFALFQSLATQVFGDDFAGNGEGGQQEGTLREQVMDLLFSRSQLQPLKSFVGTHISNAIEREVANLRSKRKRNFSYVSALLQMLGRMSSANQSSFVTDPNLLQILSQLWLFASETICKQSVEISAKILGQCRAEDFTRFMPEFVENMLVLVTKAISIQLKEKSGIGKSQRKMEKLTISTHLLEAPAHWCLEERPSFSSEAAQLCIRILRQKTGVFQAQMRIAVASHLLRLSTHLRDSLAKGRPLTDAIRCPQFWLAIASLGTMDGLEWLKMAPEFRQMRIEQNRAAKDPLCENHDNGQTLAQLHCQSCNISLCRECFSVLHLSRRNQTHRARLIGSALTPLPNVDFHEGCHRLRIGQQLLILLNPKSLSGLVELDTGNELARVTSAIGRSRSSIPSSSSSMSSFRKSSQEMPKMSIGNGKVDNGNGDEYCMEECREEEGDEDERDEQRNCHSSSLTMEGKCRFCGTQLAVEQLLNGICELEECRQKKVDACPNTMSCGHWCSGIRGHQKCGPCLHCPSAENRQDSDDLCAICLCERLGESPCLVLAKCQHIFHWRCLRLILEQKWPSGPRISFRFMQCPLCKIEIEHPALEDLLSPLRQLQADVAQKARMRLEYEGLLNNAAGSSAASNLFDDQNALLEMALAKYIYVQCSRCGKAYFGGDARCQQQLEESGLAERSFDPTELVCGGCAVSSGMGTANGGGICGRHGTDFLEFKCRFCCSVAIYFCFGSTHFCAGCHGDFQRLISMPKSALPKCPAGPRGQQLDTTEPCPLQIMHPPAGEEFALGCGICRNLDTF